MDSEGVVTFGADGSGDRTSDCEVVYESASVDGATSTGTMLGPGGGVSPAVPEDGIGRSPRPCETVPSVGRGVTASPSSPFPGRPSVMGRGRSSPGDVVGGDVTEGDVGSDVVEVGRAVVGAEGVGVVVGRVVMGAEGVGGRAASAWGEGAPRPAGAGTVAAPAGAGAGAGSSAHGSIARRFMVELGPGASTALGFADGVSPGFSSSLLGELGPGASTALGFANGVSPGFSSSLLGELGPGASTALGFADGVRSGFSSSLLGDLGPGASTALGFADGVRPGFSSSLLGDLGPGASTALGFADGVRPGFSSSLLGFACTLGFVSTLFGFSFSSRACCCRAREAAVLFGSNLGGSVGFRT